MATFYQGVLATMGHQSDCQQRLCITEFNFEKHIPRDHVSRKLPLKIDFNFIYREFKDINGSNGDEYMFRLRSFLRWCFFLYWTMSHPRVDWRSDCPWEWIDFLIMNWEMGFRITVSLADPECVRARFLKGILWACCREACPLF